MKALFLILSSILLVIIGQLLLKSGMSRIGRIGNLRNGELYAIAKKTASQKRVIFGFILYGMSSILWIYILSIVDLSFAFPFLSVAYIGVPTAAAIFLKEKIPLGQWFGICITVFGVILVACS